MFHMCSAAILVEGRFRAIKAVRTVSVRGRDENPPGAAARSIFRKAPDASTEGVRPIADHRSRTVSFTAWSIAAARTATSRH